jgi:hypothetical protein
MTADDYIELLPATWRRVNTGGLKINNRTYDAAVLNPIRRQPSGITSRRDLWEVHYDPYDVAHVWVRDHHVPGTSRWLQATWLFEAIRAEARTTFSIRTLRKTFGVTSRTIIKALARVDQPRATSKTFPSLQPFRHHIDPLINNPSVTIWSIWMNLVDEHDADVSYSTVRDYVTHQRRRADWDQLSQ